MNEQATEKADALTNGKTVVTKTIKRSSNVRAKFQRAGGQVASDEQVDHTQDLQLGGTDDMSNLKAINARVNASFGAQVQQQIKSLPDATKVNNVIFIPKVKGG